MSPADPVFLDYSKQTGQNYPFRERIPMRFRYLLIYMYLLFGSSAIAENDPLEVKSLDEGAQSPAAKIEDISWLTGHWSGSGLGGAAEDLIAPAAGGEMMGMFRHLKADGTSWSAS